MVVCEREFVDICIPPTMHFNGLYHENCNLFNAKPAERTFAKNRTHKRQHLCMTGGKEIILFPPKSGHLTMISATINMT